jgi:hypothetical protein
MTVRERTLNSQLEDALQGIESTLRARINAALGVYPGQSLDPKVCPIRGFHLQATEQLSALYVLTPGRLIIFEMANTTRETLSIVVPADRIRRVVELIQGDQLTVTLELDADQQTLHTDGEYLDAPQAAANLPEGARAGRNTAQGRLRFASYTLHANRRDEDVYDELWDFAITARNVIGY